MNAKLYNDLVAHMVGFIVDNIWDAVGVHSFSQGSRWDEKDDARYTPEAQVIYDELVPHVQRILAENGVEKEDTRRCFYGHIEERNGEMEYTHPVLYRADTLKKARAKHKAVLKTFYGEGYLNDDSWYEFGECWCCDGGIAEISPATFREMDNIGSKLR